MSCRDQARQWGLRGGKVLAVCMAQPAACGWQRGLKSRPPRNAGSAWQAQQVLQPTALVGQADALRRQQRGTRRRVHRRRGGHGWALHGAAALPPQRLPVAAPDVCGRGGGGCGRGIDAAHPGCSAWLQAAQSVQEECCPRWQPLKDLTTPRSEPEPCTPPCLAPARTQPPPASPPDWSEVYPCCCCCCAVSCWLCC